MAGDEQLEELRRLIAALTERVYRLEQRLELRPPPVETRQRIKPPGAAAKINTDLESRIGGTWLNRVGIVAVLIGVSYFLKFAFDNEWVGPSSRVIIGLVCGVAVVFWSEYVRRSGYAIFSYSLKAIGIGVLYLSLWASCQLYGLVPISMAFVAMTAVTAATVALALWQDAQVIAAFAAVGAFITPLALSTGINNALSLFFYIFILDAGVLVLLRYRDWMRIVGGAYIGTLILYSSWHSNFYSSDQFFVAMAGLTAPFVVFALAPFVDRRKTSSDVLVVLALVNAAAYFFQVWQLFEPTAQVRESALVAVALAFLYFAASYFLKPAASPPVTDVHLAIAAGFLMIAVPIGLQAQWITLAWLVEAAALIAVSGRANDRTMRTLGAIALALGVGRLLMVDNFTVSRLVLNERMMVSAVAVAALAFVAYHWHLAAPILIVAINVVALVAFNREIRDAFSAITRDFGYSALWMTYGAALMFVGFWKSSRFLRYQALILIFITIFKVFLYDTSWLNRGYRILSLIALGLLLLITSFLYQRDWFHLNPRTPDADPVEPAE